MRVAAITSALVAAVALAGCAQGGTTNSDSAKDLSGEQRRVASTVEELQSAAKDKNGTKICAELVTAQLRNSIDAKACPKTVKDLIRETDEVDLNVTKVTLNGTKATAVVEEKTSDDRRRVRTMELEKTAGRWRISSLGKAGAVQKT